MAFTITPNGDQKETQTVQHESSGDAHADLTNLTRFIPPAALTVHIASTDIRVFAAPVGLEALPNDPIRQTSLPYCDLMLVHKAHPSWLPIQGRLPDGTPVHTEHPINHAHFGYNITDSMDPGSDVTLHHFTTIATFHEKPVPPVQPAQIAEIDNAAAKMAAQTVNHLAKISPGYVWPNETLETVRRYGAPHRSPSDTSNPLHIALAALPASANTISTNPNANWSQSRILSDDVCSMFSNAQAPAFIEALHTNGPRKMSFRVPSAPNAPRIGHVSTKVIEMDDAETTYFTSNLLPPKDAAPHREPFRKVKDILTKFAIHHITPDRTQVIVVHSPIYLDQHDGYQTVLVVRNL